MSEEEQKTNNEEEFSKWLKIAMSIAAIILLVSGFGFGYLYKAKADHACIENPFKYLVDILNKYNNDDFVCNCLSGSNPNGYKWDKEGPMKETIYFIQNPLDNLSDFQLTP